MVVPPFTPCPATGDAFIGRQGLVRNLRRRIARGESLAVIGGPKLGKTSLVRTALQGLTDYTVLEIDVGADPSPRIEVVPGSIVVLDNLDSIAESAMQTGQHRRDRRAPIANHARPLRSIGRRVLPSVPAVGPSRWGDATADRPGHECCL